MGKLYTLGILRTVNCRKDFRERLASTDLGRHTLSSYQWNQEPLVAAAPVNWGPVMESALGHERPTKR
ncbi:hypothetical protein SCP_0211330 [Sparassis crispa]|uniref:Uncharacterized protein n=1 Tax=Sparassis crispa TaxID=139825 RepID=A0A401GCR9_9APHY|nr:hypothetical protein SCP_0211330 [Sparassis crispa]GBE79931.1 hypothetical protein SCP_0211330 [Sparassis crispa]